VEELEAAFRIAVLVHCSNDAATIDDVVRDFRAALPDAVVYVYVYDDDGSARTLEVAAAAGAVVRRERLLGKSDAVRRMFAEVDADIYVMVSGDDTCDAASAPRLVQAMLDCGADVVDAVRVPADRAAYRAGHAFGHRLVSGIVTWIFGHRVTDMPSGYRLFSRRFVKSFPALSPGFEIETELTVHALEQRMPMTQVNTPYGGRPGAASPLRRLRDAVRVFVQIVRLLARERPFTVFAGIGIALAVGSLLLGVPLFVTSADSGLAPRFPTAILASVLLVLGCLSVATGLLLDAIAQHRRETRRLAYLGVATGPPARPGHQT
jgi:hypothetical protein